MNKCRSSEGFDWYVQYVPFLIAAFLFVICTIIELLEIDISHEMRGAVYHNFGLVVYLSSIILSILYGRKYGLKPVIAVACTAVCFFLIFSSVTALIRDIEVSLFGTGSIATFRSAVFLLPACWLLAFLFKEDMLQLCDYLTPYFFYAHGTVTLACWVEGCCAGRSCGWGLLNPLTGLKAFPLQPLIVILAVSVAYWGLTYARKIGYKTNGKVFAYSLIAYGLGRYILEFMSDDMRILGVLSFNSLCSLAMIAAGGLLSYFIYKKSVLEENNETENI